MLLFTVLVVSADAAR